MRSGRDRRRIPFPAAAAVLLGCGIVLIGISCGSKDAPAPMRAEAVPPSPSGTPAAETRLEGRVVSLEASEVYVDPQAPNRDVPPKISVKSVPGREIKVRSVQWYVNGIGAGSEPRLPADGFHRGDRIRAVVAVGVAGEEFSVETKEVVAANSPPVVSDVEIEPRAPVSGGIVHAVVRGADPDGDPMRFRYEWYVDDRPVPSGPGGDFTLAGVKRDAWVHVKVTPNDGMSDGAWKESLRHQVVNALPVVISEMPSELPSDRRFVYRIVAEDPDGDPLTYTLKEAPPGMSLNGSTLEWQVPPESIGKPLEAVVEITDGRGGRTVQNISMTIRPPR